MILLIAVKVFLDRSLSDVSRCVCFGWVLSLGRSEVVFLDRSLSDFIGWCVRYEHIFDLL